MFDSSPICEEDQVFTFTGHVESVFSEPANLVRGYALASNPIAVIDAMRDAGFVVIAMSSLTDLRQMQKILTDIQCRVSEADCDGDVLMTDAMSSHIGPYAPEQVFTFTGRVGNEGPLSAGFMVAESAEALTNYLGSFHFYADAATSLHDLNAIAQELHDVALGQGEATACLDLLGVTELAA